MKLKTFFGLLDRLFFSATRTKPQSIHLAVSQKPTANPPDKSGRYSDECTLRIIYTDLSGEKTTRDIRPYKTDATNRRFSAWCNLRQQKRTFDFAGIEGGVDLITGETLTKADIFKKIHPTRKAPF